MNKQLQNQNVLVMGLGEFGGGVGVTRFLCTHGALVTVTDMKSAAQLQVSVDQLADLNIRWKLGTHEEQDFDACDVLVVNPAIKPGNKYVERCLARNIRVTSEMELFLESCPARIIAVTGSAGKSTTATMIHELLHAHGVRSFLGGNIGHSLLAELPLMSAEDWVVLEISSFQLESLRNISFAPHIAVVTSFFPNHLDWHGTVAHYRTAKQKLLQYQSSNDWLIVPSVSMRSSEERLSDWPTSAAKITTEDCPINAQPLKTWLRIPADHIVQNAQLAINAVQCAGYLDHAVIEKTLRGFSGLPDRLEFLGEINGVRYCNDSKATTPEATMKALSSFDQPIILLAGGADKGVDLEPLVNEIIVRVKAVVYMGETGITMSALTQQLSPTCSQYLVRDFEEACQWSLTHAEAGDVVLLSPGCASFGWFSNYRERGSKFRDFVLQHQPH